MRQIFTHFHRGKVDFSVSFYTETTPWHSDCDNPHYNSKRGSACHSRRRCTTMSEHESSAGKKLHKQIRVSRSHAQLKNINIKVFSGCGNRKSCHRVRMAERHSLTQRKVEGNCWMNSRELFSGETYTVFSHFLSPTQTVASKKLQFWIS